MIAPRTCRRRRAKTVVPQRSQILDGGCEVASNALENCIASYPVVNAAAVVPSPRVPPQSKKGMMQKAGVSPCVESRFPRSGTSDLSEVDKKLPVRAGKTCVNRYQDLFVAFSRSVGMVRHGHLGLAASAFDHWLAAMCMRSSIGAISVRLSIGGGVDDKECPDVCISLSAVCTK